MAVVHLAGGAGRPAGAGARRPRGGWGALSAAPGQGRAGGGRRRRVAGPRAAAPPASPEEALEVLPGGREEGLGVDLGQAPEAEPAEAVPVLRLAEERLDPHAALPEGLQVGRRALVGPHSVEVLGPEGAHERAACAALGARRPHGAGGADRLLGAVDPGLDAIGDVVAAQEVALRAAVRVLRRLIAEARGPVDAGAAVPVGEGHVSADAGVLQRRDAFEGGVVLVARHLAGVQAPAE